MHPSVEKELSNSDRFRANLEKIAFWRLAAVVNNGRYCRESLDKAFALSGHTGNPIFDLWVYVVQALPWFIPATFVFIPVIFATLITIVKKLLTFVTTEPKVIQETIEVPFLWFFSTSQTISKTVMVPVIHAPDPKVATGVALVIVIVGIMGISGILKKAFLFELAYRRRLLMRHAAKTE